jgi:hypothetical protein
MLIDRTVSSVYAEYVVSLQMWIRGWNKQLEMFVFLVCEYRCLDIYITLGMDNILTESKI